MTVLAITSSTAAVGVAIAAATAEGPEVLASRQISTDRRHAEELTPMVAEVLNEAGLSVHELGGFAVDIGPGRFTGLRVGLATVRTLAFAADKLIVPMTSLEILAAEHETHDGPMCAVVDARRNEVFQQRFHHGAALDEPAVGLAADLAALAQPGDLIVGDGADRYAEFYGAGTMLEGQEPQATTLALRALDRQGQPGPQVEPLYLRDADVQINIKTRHNT